MCALFDEKRVFISEQEGGVIPSGDFPWRWTLCGWSMAFNNPQVLVIPDTLEDARWGVVGGVGGRPGALPVGASASGGA